MQVWMLVLAALAVGVPIAIHLREQRRKSVAVALVMNRALVVGGSRFPLAVTYGDAQVSRPRLMVFAIGNIGNVSIKTEDFVSPLTIALAKGQILASDVTRTRPADLPMGVSHSGDALELTPCLMNASDVVEVQCLVDGAVAKEDVTIRGRILGVSTLPLLTVPRTSWGEPYRNPVVEDVVVIAAAAVLIGGVAWATWVSQPTVVTYVVAAAGTVALGLFTRFVLRRGHRSRLLLTP